MHPENEVPHTRDKDVEEFSNRILIHPISDWLAARLAPAGVHPNWVSLAGLGAGLIAAICYANTGWQYSAWAGFGFMIIWHIMDGADGQVARLSGKSSQMGKVVDGIADYSVFGTVYIALAWLGTESMGLNVWLLGFAAAFSHALQSASYERQREKYAAWTRVESSSSSSTAGEKAPHKEPVGKLAIFLDTVYTRAQAYLDRDSALAANLKRLGELPAQTQMEIRTEYRARFAPQVQLWSLLSANIHTLAIFLFALFGNAWDYFLFEIIALNLLLVVLSAHQTSTDKNFLAWMDNVVSTGEDSA